MSPFQINARERINFSGKAIIVTSEAGPLFTIIDGGAEGAVVTFNAGEGRGAVIAGFTITNGGALTLTRKQKNRPG